MTSIRVSYMTLPVLIACIVLAGCLKSFDKEEDDDAGAPGGGKKGKAISFKYDSRAPKEYLRVQKGKGEGAPVEVYVGKTKVGRLAYGTEVQKIGEEKGWYKIRYRNIDCEFFGFIRYSDAVPKDKPRDRSIILVADDAEPDRYTIEQVEEKLNEILKVPYRLEVIEERPEVKTKKVFASGRSIDGYDGLKLLRKFHDEPEAYILANKMYKELGKIYPRAPAEYKQVIDLYGKALQMYRAKNMRMFEKSLKNAEKKRDFFSRSF